MNNHKLDSQQKEEYKSFKKYRRNFLAFVEECCVIQDRKSGSDIPFVLWPGQRDCLKDILTERFLIILKARQLGLTWMTAAYVLFRAIFNRNELIIIISATEELAVEFLDRVKFMFDKLPDYMKPTVGKRNTTELIFGIEKKDKQGRIVTSGLNSAIKSVASTPNAGQSKTISLLIIDESALGRYCKDIWSAAKPTLEHSDGKAIVISNPTKTAPGWAWTRDIYTNSMKGLNVFKRIFLNWACVPGRGDDFLDLQRMDGLDETDIIMQYPTTEAEAISAMLGSYFGQSVERHVGKKGIRGYLQTDEIVDGDDTVSVVNFRQTENGLIEIWELPYDKEEGWDFSGWEKRYAIGSDVSEGLGKTNSVAYVIDRLSDQIVCRMLSNRIDAHMWADKIHELGKFYNNDEVPALACVERTGPGQTTVKRLQELDHPQYVKLTAGKAGNPVTKTFGWNESQQSKYELCGDFKAYLDNTPSTVLCGQLIDECTTFIRHDNGQLKHEAGKLDDCVMGAGCTIQAKKFMGEPAVRVGEDRISEIRIKKMKKEQNLPLQHIEEWENVSNEIDMLTQGEDDDDYFTDED